jgi:hypothetical protein
MPTEAEMRNFMERVNQGFGGPGEAAKAQLYRRMMLRGMDLPGMQAETAPEQGAFAAKPRPRPTPPARPVKSPVTSEAPAKQPFPRPAAKPAPAPSAEPAVARSRPSGGGTPRGQSLEDVRSLRQASAQSAKQGLPVRRVGPAPIMSPEAEARLGQAVNRSAQAQAFSQLAEGGREAELAQSQLPAPWKPVYSGGVRGWAQRQGFPTPEVVAQSAREGARLLPQAEQAAGAAGAGGYAARALTSSPALFRGALAAQRLGQAAIGLPGLMYGALLSTGGSEQPEIAATRKPPTGFFGNFGGTEGE